MTRFTTENTEGYSVYDLADLNAAFEVRLSELRCQGVDVDKDDAKSLRDFVAEKLLADFDDLSDPPSSATPPRRAVGSCG